MNGLKAFLDSSLNRALTLLATAAVVAAAAGWVFSSMHTPEPIVAGPGVTEVKMLSEFEPQLKDTPADTPVYIMRGEQPGATVLLMGGTHPQEISGLMAAILMIENAKVERGTLVVIPQSNRSGFTHTDPLEAFDHKFTLDTGKGERWFRVGMRLANPIHQWPDPDLFVHPQSGERLVGWEARNLNRNYPGDFSGRYISRLGAAILDMSKKLNVDLVYDMHEAYPEYSVINMLVVHQRASELASIAAGWGLAARGIKIDVQVSPLNLRGLSHREFGDHTKALAVLSETANPAMGRFRGALTRDLLVGGKDVNYIAATKQTVPGVPYGRLFVPFDEKGHPLSERTARNVATLEELVIAFNELYPDNQIVISNIPQYEDLVVKGLEPYLLPPPG